MGARIRPLFQRGAHQAVLNERFFLAPRVVALDECNLDIINYARFNENVQRIINPSLSRTEISRSDQIEIRIVSL